MEFHKLIQKLIIIIVQNPIEWTVAVFFWGMATQWLLDKLIGDDDGKHTHNR